MIAGLDQEDRLAMRMIGAHRRAAEEIPAARRRNALDAGLHAAYGDRSGGRLEPRVLPARRRELGIEPAEIGVARQGAEHIDAVISAREARVYFAGRHAGASGHG